MSSTTLRVVEERIRPTRGLIPLHTSEGKPLSVVDIHRAIRLNRIVYKIDKVDLLANGPIPDNLKTICAYAYDGYVGMNVSLSLRTDCSAPPDGLKRLKDLRFHDVFLCPSSIGAPNLQSWLDACKELELRIRIQLRPPFPSGLDAAAVAGRLGDAGVTVLNIALDDPFASSNGAETASGQATLDAMISLSSEAEAREIETNLIGAPLCVIPEEHRINALNTKQFFLDHQQYNASSYDFAQRIWGLTPAMASLAIMLTLGRMTTRENKSDVMLLAYIYEKQQKLFVLLGAVRKLFRHWRFPHFTPKPIEDSQAAYDAQVDDLCKKERNKLGPECSKCRFLRICDHDTPTFRKHLPGLAVRAIEGEVCPDPLVYIRGQRKYYDALDTARLDIDAYQVELAEKANHIANNLPSDRKFSFLDYASKNTFVRQLPGAVQWNSLTNTEKVSTTIVWLEAPFTISVVFGGGIADYIGYGIGRHTRLVCPMTAYSHNVVLHVDRDGRFVLLRDGSIVRPVEFEGAHCVPAVVSTVAPIHLSIWNIDRSIYTQNVQVWYGDKEKPPAPPQIKYSIIIVSMMFTRRLQAVLRSLAHLKGVDYSTIEIIIAYVPGLDATEDLIMSAEQAYPHLRIVRSPFTEQYSKAKGFVINESMNLASGEWLILLDSDILVPPDLFIELEKTPADAHFAAPSKRKMLPASVTAKILMGEISPWERWQELLDGPGEYRVREGGEYPIGFFQCVRTESAKKIRYPEFGHFEGADWDFIVLIGRNCGSGVWLKDATVCHLDHGGSQWYGAQKHM